MKRIVIALLALLAAPLAAVQTAIPTSGDCATLLDEAPSGDNLTCSLSAVTQACSEGDAFTQVQLSSVTDPASSSGHILRFQCDFMNGTGLFVALFQGATQITIVYADCGGMDGAYTLSAAEANAITDYSNLSIVVTAYFTDYDCQCEQPCGTTYSVDYVRLEVPDAPGGGGATRRAIVVQ